MNKRSFRWHNITVTVLFAVAFAASSIAQEGPIREAVELNEQVVKLYIEGQYFEAIPLAQRMLAISEEALGPDNPNTATALKVLAKLYREVGAYTMAEPLNQRALAIREKVLGLEHSRTADALSDLGSLYHHTGAYSKAETLLKRALAIHEKVLGSEHPDTVTSLNNLASLYRDMGADSEAEPLLKRSLAFYENTLGPEHPYTATALANLGGLYSDRGAYSEAEPLLERALAIHEKTLAPDDPDIANSLSTLAALYKDTGVYNKAEPLYQRALAIREKTLGPDHPDTAASLNNIAALHHSMGATAKAGPLFQRALAIHEKALGPEHPQTSYSLNNLAMFYVDAGNYAEAEPLLRRALAIREKVLGPEHPDTATSLNNLAKLYRGLGADSEAEPLYQRALAIREKALGPEHPDVAQSLNNLAALYNTTGAYSKAEPLYRRALAIREKRLGPEHPDVAQSLNNLAFLYLDTGAYFQAEPLLKRVLVIHEKALGTEHRNTATSLNNLGGLYSQMGNYAEAEPLYERALAIRQKVLGPEHPDTALSLNNLAALYNRTGAYSKAEPLYERALSVREKGLRPDHPDIAVSLTNLAILKWASNEPAKAVSLLQRAQSINEKNIGTFLLYASEERKQAYLQQLRGNTFVNISLSLATSDNNAAALALNAILQYKGRVLDAMSDSIARLRRNVKPEHSELFEELTEVAQKLSNMFQIRARIFQIRARIEETTSDNERKKLQERLAELIRDTAAINVEGPRDLMTEEYREHLQKLAERQERLENELASRSAEFRREAGRITLVSVQQAIPDNGVLIEWLRYVPFDPKGVNENVQWGKPRYVVCLLKREGSPVIVDVGEAEVIEILVQGFRKVLTDPRRAIVKEVAKQLSEKLFEPLRSYLGNTERLLISPDGALNLLPFAALVDGKGEYLAKRFEINYLTSGRDLLRLASEASSRSGAVVLADPDYDNRASILVQGDTSIPPQHSNDDLDRRGMVFTSLPGTIEEAKALKVLLHLNDQNVLTGANATEAKLKQLHGPRLLHIATHGFFLGDQASSAADLTPVGLIQHLHSIPLGENALLRSGIALAGANPRRSGANNDGILTAAEMARIDLSGTELVVLSACETGVGDVQNGEGVYGLRRALVLAGAQTQVASLWKVPDAATKDLMVDYYERLLKGEGRSAALRDAQQKMIRSQEHSHPYFWAAFVPIGNWVPLPAER
jgi:CHAT domain-containing protein/Tfp pilus assembly protein PilF